MEASNSRQFAQLADGTDFSAHIGGCADLDRQAGIARALGSPFVAAVLEAGSRQLARGPRTWALFEEWPDDRASAALALRFNAALHALARKGEPRSLAALYRGEHLGFDAAIGAALDAHDDFIAGWMGHPTQTNEVARSAAILAALKVLAAQFGMPFELLELGSSAGLNLNVARYSFDLGGLEAGTPGSPVRIAPMWRGGPPPDAPVAIASARGVDLAPLDPRDELTRERLLSYVWADQAARTRRLEQALLLARDNTPLVEQANAATWLARRLAEPQESGVCRVVFHSMVRQYFSLEERRNLTGSLARARDLASAERPLAWIAFEWNRSRDEVALVCASWPDGAMCHLATCHPYGEWIIWHG